MSRRAIIALLFLLTTMSLRAQSLERSVITVTGGSSRVAHAEISWSVGEAFTERRRGPDGKNITQGFQQPYFSVASVRTGNFSGRPGDTSTMDILLEDMQGVYGSLVSSIDLTLQFNATLLEPIVEPSTGGESITILSDDIRGGVRTLILRIPAANAFTGWAGSNVLGRMRFAVGLGNDSVTTMELQDPRPSDAPLKLRTASGEFSLLGICYEGGPRLVDPIRRPTVQLRPNPASATTVLEFDIHEAGDVLATVVDLFGRPVQTIADQALNPGHYSLTFDAATIPSGSYMVILETRSARISHPLVVRR